MNKANILDTYARYVPMLAALGDLLKERDKNTTKYNGCKIQVMGYPDDFEVYLDGHTVCHYSFKCIYQANPSMFYRVFNARTPQGM